MRTTGPLTGLIIAAVLAQRFMRLTEEKSGPLYKDMTPPHECMATQQDTHTGLLILPGTES